MKTIGVKYRRTSTGRQDYSLAAQESQCDAYCQRMRFDEVLTFEDPDTSTRIPFKDREGGRRMLAEIKRQLSSEVQIHVVVTKQDRLGRDTIDQIETIRQMWQWGVLPHLVLETGPLPKNPSNELLMEIKASTNQYERNQIRERIRTTLNHRRANGFVTGQVPYGFNKVPTDQRNPNTGKQIFRIEPNEYEQSWIKQMATWKNEKFGFEWIADKLNELGVPTKVAAGTLHTVKNDRKSGVKVKALVKGNWKTIGVRKVLVSRSTIEFLVSQNIPITWKLPEDRAQLLKDILAAKQQEGEKAA